MMNALRIFQFDRAADEPAKGSVAWLINLYLDHLAERSSIEDYCADALKNNRHYLGRFTTTFGTQQIEGCRQHDLTRWLSMNPQWKSIETKKHCVTILVACFTWGEDEGLIGRCPYKRPKLLAKQKTPGRRPADPAEYVMLMRKGSRALRRALFCLRRTGIRPKEMRELKLKNLRLDEEFPHLLWTKHKTVKTTGEDKKVGLDLATANFLRALIRNQPTLKPTDCLFANCHGTPWDRHTFARHLRRTAKRIGLDAGVEKRVSAYCLRHTYVCDAIRGENTTRAIADQVGHTTTKMIDTVYGRHTREGEEHLAQVAEQILHRRKRKKTTPKPKPTPDFIQPTLFD